MTYLEAVTGSVIARTYAYMEETGRPDSFERFPYLSAFLERVKGRAEQMVFEQTAARCEALLNRLTGGRENLALVTAAELAITATLVTEFAAYLHYYTGNRATLQLAYEMCGEFSPDYAEVTKQWKTLSLCFHVEKKDPLFYANIEAGDELLSYLSGDEPAGQNFYHKMECYFHGGVEYFSHRSALQPMYVRDTLADRGAELLAREGSILPVCGCGGRRFLVKHIARHLKRDVLFVQSSRLCGGEDDDRNGQLEKVVHQAFLYSCIVCLSEGAGEQTKGGDEEEAKRRVYAARALSEAGISVILCTEKADDAAADLRGEQNDGMPTGIQLMPLSREERIKVWQGFAGEHGWTTDIERCSILYKMNAKEIALAVKEWKNKLAASQSEAAEGLSEICCRILCRNQKRQLGSVMVPRVGFLDLIVSKRVQRTLKEICCGALRGYRIYEEWGLAEQYPYGKSISLLLAGPPGTGKTMTAHVLAYEIGVPLYQVELPHIMDKYIGETEKHLEQIFAFAEKANVVLFFDEADALFGKRGEVKEGKDRYANMEVSYLLQRIEQFEGVVILATNFYQHIDKAFLRRMKFVLKYQEPDEEMRKKIWESCLAKKLPREEIDTRYLARQFAFSGGVIKNVIQCACISALYEGRPLCMEHVLWAVRMEYEKLERSVTPELWGEYGYLMEEASL